MLCVRAVLRGVYAWKLQTHNRGHRGLTVVIVSGEGLSLTMAGLYQRRAAVTRHARARFRPFKQPHSADWGSKWRGRGSRRRHRGGEERRGNRKRGAVDGEMQESNQFNRRPCLKRRGLSSDRDPSQEAEPQNRLIEVVKSSRWLILHNAQPRQPREETPPRPSLTPAAECRMEPLLCVPSQTPSLAEQLEKYLPLIFFLSAV